MPENETIEIVQKWWSPSQIADALSVSGRTVTNWLVGGLLTGHRVGPRLWRISDADLALFLKRTRASADLVRAGAATDEFGDALCETQHAETYAGVRTEAER